MDGIESEWRAEQEGKEGGAAAASRSSYYPGYASWMSYGTSLIGTIIENLQIQASL